MHQWLISHLPCCSPTTYMYTTFVCFCLPCIQSTTAYCKTYKNLKKELKQKNVTVAMLLCNALNFTSDFPCHSLIRQSYQSHNFSTTNCDQRTKLYFRPEKRFLHNHIFFSWKIAMHKRTRRADEQTNSPR